MTGRRYGLRSDVTRARGAGGPRPATSRMPGDVASTIARAVAAGVEPDKFVIGRRLAARRTLRNLALVDRTCFEAVWPITYEEVIVQSVQDANHLFVQLDKRAIAPETVRALTVAPRIEFDELFGAAIDDVEGAVRAAAWPAWLNPTVIDEIVSATSAAMAANLNCRRIGDVGIAAVMAEQLPRLLARFTQLHTLRVDTLDVLLHAHTHDPLVASRIPRQLSIFHCTPRDGTEPPSEPCARLFEAATQLCFVQLELACLILPRCVRNSPALCDRVTSLTLEDSTRMGFRFNPVARVSFARLTRLAIRLDGREDAVAVSDDYDDDVLHFGFEEGQARILIRHRRSHCRSRSFDT